MGNATSNTKNSKLANEIDRIASNYILSQNFSDMNKLSEKDHCDKVVVLTAKIINQKLNPLEQKEMVKRIENGNVMKEEIKKDEKGKEKEEKEDKEKEEKEDKTKEEKEEKGEKKEENGKNDKKEKKKGEEEGADEGTEEEEEEEGEEADEEKDTAAQLKKKKKKGGAEPIGVEGAEPLAEPLDCVKIAKFYVKIAHLYAAIMKTVNPVIISKDKNGKLQKYDLMSKQTMPTDEEIQSIEHNNFCTKRLNNLIQDSDYNERDPKNILMTLKPRFCNINYNKKTKSTRKFYEEERNNRGASASSAGASASSAGASASSAGASASSAGASASNEDKEKTEASNPPQEASKAETSNPLQEASTPPQEGVLGGEPPYEIGIPELMKLYYDVFDETTNDFTSMSDTMRPLYEHDVETFYTTFTGKPMPTDENGQALITRFDQIPLRDYHKNDKCKPGNMFTQNYEGSLNDRLFKDYAMHINKMMTTMNTNQDKLYKILQQLFKFQEPKKKKKEVKKEEVKKEEKKPSPEEEEDKDKAPSTQGQLAIPHMQQAGPEAAQGPAPAVAEKANEVAAPAVANEVAVGPAESVAKANEVAVGPAAAVAKANEVAPIAGPIAGPIAAPIAAPIAVAEAAPAQEAPAPTAAAETVDTTKSGDIQVGGADEIVPEAKTDASKAEAAEPAVAKAEPAVAKAEPAVAKAEPAKAEPASKAEPAVAKAEPASEAAKAEPASEAAQAEPASEAEEDEDTVIIHPNLDDALLQSLINTTRKLIVELYVTCETHFLEGIVLFESIVAVQLAKTTGSQIKLLNDATINYLEHNSNL